MKLVLSITAFLLWILSYPICEYFYEEDIEKWYDLRMILYAVSFSLIYLQNNYPPTRLSKALNTVFACLVVEDLTDRLFNIQTYEINDFLALFIGLYLAKRDYDRN